MRWLVAVLVVVSFAGCAGETESPTEDLQSTTDTSSVTNSTTTSVTRAATTNQSTAPRVVADLSVSDVTGYAPLDVVFTVDASPAQGVQWWLNDTVDGVATALGAGDSVPASVEATLGAGNHSIELTVRVAGIDASKRLTIDVPERPSLDFRVADATTMSGLLTPLDVVAGPGLTCTWLAAGAAIKAGDDCQVSMRFGTVGTHTVTVDVTDGVTTETHEAIVQAEMPKSTGKPSGQVFMYNTGGVGVSNIVALVTGQYNYINRDTVSIQGRGMADTKGVVAAEYMIFKPDGTLFAGPWNIANHGDGDWSSAAWTISAPVASYFLATAVYMEDGASFVKDTSDAGSDHKRFSVIA